MQLVFVGIEQLSFLHLAECILYNKLHTCSRYGRELLDLLGGQVSDLKSAALILVMRIMEAILRTCQVDGAVLVRPVFAIILCSE